MVEETVARFRGQECDHVDEIVFVGRDIWSTKTRGCDECGMTQMFVREQEFENDTTDMTVQHHDDSDLAPNEDEGDEDDSEEQNDNEPDETISPEELSEELASATDSTAEEIEDGADEFEIESLDEATVVENLEDDREKMTHRMTNEDFSYRELQSVSSHFDDVKGNQSYEDLFNDLVAQEPSALETAVNDVLEDQE